ncbi:N-myc-interactor-like [Puntigrus tetrazona]|uniref:N-myc-interactor-like n=1 Tax=Puntigrus tetrazona TaxID=1606681 RepID=UPI001C8B0729|nr:N-myc-interactor-like [Puntigrus tetrazona]XP_043088145.1 N-myc-interactor-like [Puntigrus tetrazona]XP_043088146.1 N-myc-interactor-like [Puntigrus tetrazona]
MSQTENRANGELLEDMSNAEEQIKKYKDLVESADNGRSRLLLEKAEAETEKRKAETELQSFMDDEERSFKKFNIDLQEVHEEMKSLDRVNQDLKRELYDLKKKLQLKREESDSLQRKFKIEARIPMKPVKFERVLDREECDEDDDDDDGDQVRSVFTVTQRPSFLLKGGQALITFEEEKVAEQILRLAKCSVACDKAKMDVKPYALSLDPSVKFEVHIQVSKKSIRFSKAPPTLPEERMRDRLELSFSRVSRGGGEVEKLEYHRDTGSGRVTFLNTGVAENLVQRGSFRVDTGSDAAVLELLPLYDYKLRKFQTYSGAPTRTVLLGGIQPLMDEEDLQDHLEIHFQKPSNYGGEVENIRYVPEGDQLMAFFSEDIPEKED